MSGPPTLIAAIVRDDAPDVLETQWSEPVVAPSLFGLALPFTAGTPRTLESIVDGLGSSTLRFGLSGALSLGDAATFEIEPGNAICDLSGRPAPTQSVVVENLVGGTAAPDPNAFEIADADLTLTVLSGLSWHIYEPSTLTANRALTLGTTHARAGDQLAITRLDVSAHTVTITNGGPGADLLATLPASSQSYFVAQFDGTDWLLRLMPDVAGLTSRFVAKEAIESRTHSAVLAADDTLNLPVSAGRRYQFTFWLVVRTGAGHFQCSVTAPTGSTGAVGAIEIGSGGNQDLPDDGSVGTGAFGAAINVTDNTTGHYLIKGFVDAAIDGAIGLSWAQSTSDAAATSLYPGSSLTLTPEVSGAEGGGGGVARVAHGGASVILRAGTPLLVDVSGGAPPSITTSAAPGDGDQISVVNAVGSFGVTACTVTAHAGQTIEDPINGGFGATAVLGVESMSVTWLYDAAQSRWKVMGLI